MRFETIDLGLVSFKEAEEIQRQAFKALLCAKKDVRPKLIFCRHYPVITFGRRSSKVNILACDEELGERGIPIHRAERGGDVTYHGPGQLIAYPVFDLKIWKKDIHLFLRKLEEAVINLMLQFGIPATRVLDLTGVWVEGKKISSIGIAIRHWITFHGLSINVKKDDLPNFRLVRPCGLDVEMTAMEKELDTELEIDDIKDCLGKQLNRVFSERGRGYHG